MSDTSPAPNSAATPGDGGCAGHLQAGVGLRQDARQHRQRLDQRFGLRVRLARRGAERRVDLLEKRNEIRRLRELADERQIVVQRCLESRPDRSSGTKNSALVPIIARSCW